MVFIGAFGGSRPAVYGGQIAACRALLASRAAARVRWVLVDSTMASVPAPPLWRRGVAAARRLVRVAWLLGSSRVDGMLIFTADGASFLEKGLMAAMGRVAGPRVVLAPRSGILADDLDNGSRVRRALWRLLFRFPHVIVCQSASWADFFAVRLGRNRAQLPVIRNGVELVPIDRRTCRTDAAAPFRLLYLGWLESYKGPLVLADAFLALWRDHPQLSLDFCGTGSQERPLRAALAEPIAAGRVRLVGWVDGPAKRVQLDSADCLVLPSLREGAPNAVLEAMASGVPVVASDVGAVGEMLGGGHFGLVVPAGDALALAAAIRSVLLDPLAAAHRAQEGWQHLHEKHDVETTGEQWVGLFWPAAGPGGTEEEG